MNSRQNEILAAGEKLNSFWDEAYRFDGGAFFTHCECCAFEDASFVEEQRTAQGSIVIFAERETIIDNLRQKRFSYALLAPLKSKAANLLREKTSNRNANEFINLIRPTMAKVREFKSAIQTRLTSNERRTTLLHPISATFRSDLTRDLFLLVERGVAEDWNGPKFVEEAEKLSPSQSKIVDTRACHVFSHLNFVAVQRYAGRHGFPRKDEVEHSKQCYLTGLYRFGCPYDPRFHYDAEAKRGNARLNNHANCHGAEEDYCGSPHLNIYPNDFVRI